MSTIANQIVASTGNVFADVGLADADELLARAELLRRINSIIAHRHLTQTDAAALLSTTQPTVSDLKRGKLSRFSLQTLATFARTLACS